MKTTIELPDSLLEQARRLAEREHLTLKNLLETSLREFLKQRQQRPSFKLRDASFAGQGLQSEFVDADWEALRRAAYEGRGG